MVSKRLQQNLDSLMQALVEAVDNFPMDVVLQRSIHSLTDYDAPLGISIIFL